jgi:hypothetical protein
MSVTMQDVQVSSKTRAIVCFGPATDTTGMRPGEFFQVTIDPNMASPGGHYIRFDARPREGHEPDEIHGWQRISALTVCEVLHEGEPVEGVEPITMRVVKE